DQLRSQLRTIRSRVNSGVVLPSQQRILEVELLNASQDSLQTRHDITAAFGVLEELIGEEISPGKELAIPEIELPANPGRLPERPEYALFQSSIEVLKQRRALNEAQKVPKISAFGTTAYGRPGLDAFDDDLQAYYIVGVRLRWNFWDWRNADRQSQVLQHQKQMVEADESAFTRQLNGTLKQSLQSIHALEELIKRDGEIISLRERVVRESSSQLKNGTITATEYVTELTKANQARLTRFMHEVQLAKQKINYITILGLPWNEE
ncbi:MAG: TolC family protein, partial [Balneolaceae bacterium]|nr:TolC family protein [Balneolaceae bacterium]